MNVTQELKSVTRTRKLLDCMLWLIVAGAIFYSLMTSTPLVAAHSEWEWSGWALGILTDAAFILAISADAVLSRHGVAGGRWPIAFRWVTGLASLFLNTWSSVAEKDWVGVAIHAIAPAILICAAEVSPIYRRKFRDLEVALSAMVAEERVTKVVTSKRKTVVTKSVTPGVAQPVTPTKQAIKEAFDDGLNATEAAKRVGVSRPYISKIYKEIREALELTA
ncbi:peptidase C14 [Streptomyces sp. SID7834]|nr:peptidase C14 [Streptomyces sp. SID7834]MYT61588.1 peptidase C14 [Streptomyces sp. SID7834]